MAICTLKTSQYKCWSIPTFYLKKSKYMCAKNQIYNRKFATVNSAKGHFLLLKSQPVPAAIA